MGSLVAFLLVGFLGYFLTAVAVIMLVGALYQGGYWQPEWILDRKVKILLELSCFAGGVGAGWFFVGRKRWRREQAREKSRPMPL